MPELEIIGAPQSTFVRTTRIALEEKGVAYALTPARPHSSEIDAIHPFGRIPAMRHGDLALCESRAIIAYVDRVFGGPKLIPDDAKRAAVIEQWSSLVANAVFPAVFPYFCEYLFPASGSTDRAAVEVLLPHVRHAIDVLGRRAGDGFIAGEDFTLADMYALPILVYLNRLPESRDFIGETQTLDAYLAKHAERPSFKSTTPPPLGT
ncbi:MAG TPA: glutathione S-transferase family protein [Rhizomicrobium sp.]|nr:glutathione S-transferase family protein [Rhizomicrobium sp.]